MNIVNEIMGRMIEYFGGDVRRINHAVKVYSFARHIAVGEGMDGDDLLIVEAAGLLHDIGIKAAECKYNSTSGRYQEVEGPPIAREIMVELGLGGDVIERICHIIGHHHSYGKIDGLDFQVIVEADFIVNIFEDDMGTEQVRTVAQKYFKTATGKRLIEGMYLL